MSTTTEQAYERFDELAERRREIASMAEDHGRSLRAVASEALAGKDPLEVAQAQPTGQDLTIAMAGCESAKQELAQEICNAEAETRGVSAPQLQHVPRSAEALREHIANALDDVEERAMAAERKKQESTAYQRAFDEFNQLKGEFIRQGIAPVVASEHAKAAMKCDPNDLWPAGAPGVPKLSGRALDATIMAGGN